MTLTKNRDPVSAGVWTAIGVGGEIERRQLGIPPRPARRLDEPQQRLANQRAHQTALRRVMSLVDKTQLGARDMATDDRKRQAPDVPLAGNIHAPETFTHEVSSFALGSGVVTLTLTSMRWDHSLNPPEQRRVVTGYLTMPALAARSLANGLNAFLEERGLPAAALDRGRVQ